MSKAARRLRILSAVSNTPAPPDYLLHAIMRGEINSGTLAQLVGRLDPAVCGQDEITKLSERFLTSELRDITGDERLTLAEFEAMCAEVRHAAAMN